VRSKQERSRRDQVIVSLGHAETLLRRSDGSAGRLPGARAAASTGGGEVRSSDPGAPRGRGV